MSVIEIIRPPLERVRFRVPRLTDKQAIAFAAEHANYRRAGRGVNRQSTDRSLERMKRIGEGAR